MQRVRDSWCNVHRSAAISILVTFFNSNEILNSDESCREFANLTLENLMVLYYNCNDDDPEVSTTAAYDIVLIYLFRTVKSFCAAHSLYRHLVLTLLPLGARSR